jgi:hypothetical protein
MKTAVEFLVETLAENGILHSSDIEQANEMFKQQIIKSCMKWYDGSNDNAGEQYYNEVFKSK